MPEPKILLIDIETAPAVVLTWLDSMYEQNVIEVLQPWYLLSFAYQWLGKKQIHFHGLNREAGLNKSSYGLLSYSDKNLVKAACALLDEADLIIAHHAAFDIGKIKAQALRYGFKPPTSAKIVCTYQIAKRNFKLSSNKLDNIAALLGVGRKLPHQGKHTWLGCMKGDPAAWRTLERYNRHDVWLLHETYLRLRPFAPNHPNLSYYTRRDECPVCQSSHIIQKGKLPLMSGWKQRYKCNDCGHRFVAGPIIKP